MAQFLSSQKADALCQTTDRCRSLAQKHGVHSVNAMQAAGFYYTNYQDTARCDTCALQVSQWTPHMHPFTIHAHRSPQCPYVRSIQSQPLIFLPTTTTTHTHPQTDSIEENNHTHILQETHSMKQIRKRTFTHWPPRSASSTAQIIEAGFFSCSVGDRVICLYCNLICQQWIPNIDHPYQLHLTLSPTE